MSTAAYVKAYAIPIQVKSIGFLEMYQGTMDVYFLILRFQPENRQETAKTLGVYGHRRPASDSDLRFFVREQMIHRFNYGSWYGDGIFIHPDAISIEIEHVNSLGEIPKHD